VVALVRARPRRSGPPAWPWLTCLALTAATAGVVAGDARIAAIDRDAYAGEPGVRVAVRGTVTGVPRPQQGRLLIPVATADGRLAVEAPPPAREIQVGAEVRADGTVRAPAPWQAGRMEIAGIRRTLAARSLTPTGRRRHGLAGALDEARTRAEAALARGAPAAEADLARGFVLGQDDRIDPGTIDEFRRSGLAHLLAVSGQNVLLLALLAMPILALLGVPLRARLITIIALIAVYVPITGAGPSIQRAAIMGAAGIVAVLAGRPASRWYAIWLAAALTLAINPRAGADVGWQLSFAAVVGILLWARPIARLASGPAPSGLRRAFAEGVGVTVAATIATAPISAAHFETVSLASLPANLLALPAVAPVMWLGMLASALGQIPAIPVEPLNWLSSLLIAYIAQVAHWFGTPEWAAQEVAAPAPWTLAAIAAALLAGGFVAARALARRHRLGTAALRPRPAFVLAALPALALTLPLPAPAPAPSPSPGPASALTLTALDVGQGDAILLDPAPGPAILVDTGPPGTELVSKLAERDVDRLAAIVVTHDQSDHAGGLAAVLASIPTATVLHSGAGPRIRAIAAHHGAATRAVAAGDRVRAGRLRLRVLWPRPVPPGATRPDDPNARSIVLLAEWGRFDALLTGDAEAEVAPVDPGPVDLLKVAHHGSDDPGLPGLLERTDPGLAVISAGAGNPYGHPHPATSAALAEAGVPVARTDRDGDVEITATARSFAPTG
jgi:competence protein ComEC